MATTDNPLDRILVTGEQRLDGAILPVSNPAIDTEPLRFPSHPVTETNALYAAFDKNRHGNDHLIPTSADNDSQRRLGKVFGKERAAKRCGVSGGVRDAVRKPCQAALRVAYAARRRASERLDDVPHRRRRPSYPTRRLRDLYGSLSTLVGIRSVELENRLINHQAVALAGQQLLDGSVLGGAEDILHLHCLDDRQFLPRLHGIADRDGKPDQ